MPRMSKHRMSNITKAPKYFFFLPQLRSRNEQHRCFLSAAAVPSSWSPPPPPPLPLFCPQVTAGKRWPVVWMRRLSSLANCALIHPSLPPSLSLALTHCSREVGPAPPAYDITGLEIAAALKLPVMRARCAAKPHHPQSGGGAQGRWDWQR